MFCCNGILFVTRKITMAVANIKLGNQVRLGTASQTPFSVVGPCGGRLNRLVCSRSILHTSLRVRVDE